MQNETGFKSTKPTPLTPGEAAMVGGVIERQRANSLGILEDLERAQGRIIEGLANLKAIRESVHSAPDHGHWATEALVEALVALHRIRVNTERLGLRVAYEHGDRTPEISRGAQAS